VDQRPDEHDDDTTVDSGTHSPTAEYPDELVPPTGHLPISGELPLTGQFATPSPEPPESAEPPRRTRTQSIMVGGSIVAIVLVVAAVVIIVVTNRGDSGQAGQPTGSAQTSAAPPPSSTSSAPAPTSTPPPSGTESWHEVAGTSASGLTYSVPEGWKDTTKSRSTGRGEHWGGVAEFGTYECPQGPDGQYARSFVASGKAPTGDQTNMGGLAGDYATAFAKHWYTDPRIEVGDPLPRQVDGHEAVLVTVKLAMDPKNPDCDASAGEVVVLAVKLDRGVGLLTAVSDLEGGPSDPPCAPDGVIQQIFGTVKVR
jgi:hypothetical protein